MLLYNTLTRRKERFEPIKPPRVTVYTCGPTVYRDVHIGNLRSYLMADWLKRVLTILGYGVFHVKNITDVGHMRQELLDQGEDKVIAAARAAGTSSMEIARKYTELFLADEALCNILPADLFPRATSHIPQCIHLVERMVQKGHAYLSGGNLYFDITTFPSYGRLSGNVPESLQRAGRTDPDPNKRHAEDFALWKAAEPGREMKWESPWGEGFPGWHIECSAMSLHYLGERFDIHTGGVDNVFPHHDDEIAQSESVTGHQVVNFWVHGQHLLADGLKMSKSQRNDYTIRDLQDRGFDPLAFRYLCLTAHYRSRLNFSFHSLMAAQRGLSHLRRFVEDPLPLGDFRPRGERAERWRTLVREALTDDLAIPLALGHTWAMLGDRVLSSSEKAALLVEGDEVFGLDLARWPEAVREVPGQAAPMRDRRASLRKGGRYDEADALRKGLESQGVEVRDLPEQTQVLRRSRAEWKGRPREISSSRQVPSLLEEQERYDVTVSLVARNNWTDLIRCYRSVRAHGGSRRVQVVIVEGGSRDRCRQGVLDLSEEDPHTLVWLADHPLGEGGFRNVTLRQALGSMVVLLDTSVELTGDIFEPMSRTLADTAVGATGPKGLVSADMQAFEEQEQGPVDAMTLYCFAFPRRILPQAGWMDERFRFYRHLDLDYSFSIRSCGYSIRATPGLPLLFHPHRVWEEMDPPERTRRSRANFYLFYRRWHHRTDLLTRGV